MILLASTFTTYQASGVFPAVAANDAIAQILNLNAGLDATPYLGLLRLRVVALTAVETSLGLLVPATVGTATTPLAGQFASRANLGTGVSASGVLAGVAGWSVAPTYPGSPVYLEQDILPATVGAGIEWTWPDDDPLQVALTRVGAAQDVGLVLRNLGVGASASLAITARWREFGPPPGGGP